MAGRVVVGIDGSEGSLPALVWAHDQAALVGADLEVVIAWEALVVPSGWPVASPTTGIDYDPAEVAERIASEAMDKALGGRPEGTRTVIVQGHPANVLVDASEGADLLVVGSSGHGAFVGMLLGSVSSYCAHRAHCPVVITRAPQG